jgi:hypothetical protein
MKMNARLLLATAIALSSITHVFAQQADNGLSPAAKTRAKVIAQLTQAEADGSAASYRFPDATNRGTSPENAISPQSESVIAGQKTRAEVRSELQQAQAHGTDMPTGFAAFHTPFTAASNAAPTRTANHQ